MKRQRLRVIGRWGVWGCAVLVSLLAVSSIWLRVGIGIQIPDVRRAYEPRRVLIGVSNTHLWVQDYSRYSLRVGFSGGQPHTKGLRVEALNRDEFPEARFMDVLLPAAVHGGESRGSYQRYSFPLVYPMIVLLGWSLLLIYGCHKRKGVGCCCACGYSLVGLDGVVCPECGAGDDSSS